MHAAEVHSSKMFGVISGSGEVMRAEDRRSWVH
jgi:hypothetical protein